MIGAFANGAPPVAADYPGSKLLSLKLVYAPDGQILGAQAVGADGADKRIDVIATAIKAGLKVQDLCDLELSYAPPFGSAKDPVNIAGYVASNVLKGYQEIIDWRELRDLLTTAPEDLQLIDVRTAEEFEIVTLPKARNIPLDALRERINELDPAKPTVCCCARTRRRYLPLPPPRLLRRARKPRWSCSRAISTRSWRH